METKINVDLLIIFCFEDPIRVSNAKTWIFGTIKNMIKKKDHNRIMKIFDEMDKEERNLELRQLGFRNFILKYL